MKRVGRIYFVVMGIILLQIGMVNAQILEQPGQPNTQGDVEEGPIDSLEELDYGQPRELEIGDISITGATTLNHNALISLTGLQVGDQIQVPGPALSDAIKKLWGQGIIGNVKITANKIEDGKIFLNIDLTERARLTKFNIKGVNSTQESDLDEDLELIRGRVVTDALINNAKRKVENYFIEKGFRNVEVDIQQIRDTLMSNSNSMALEINVDKNDKVKIQNINVKGNEVFTDRKIVSQMGDTHERVRFTLVKDFLKGLTNINGTKIKNFFTKKKETSFKEVASYLSDKVKLNIFNTSKFIADNYKADKDKIIEFYNSRGYRDAKIVDDSVYDYQTNLINIDLTVDEGTRYYFGNIDWSGNYVYEDQTLQSVLGINKGDVYDQSTLQKRLNYNPTGPDVSALYMDNGYLFFNVQPVETSIKGDSIDIEMRVFEGEQATVDEVIINGNDRTNDHVIRREIRTLPGEKFSREKLIRTQRELSQLGYFDPEQIGIEPIPNPQEGTVDIEYSLVERPSDQIELSGGWGGYYGFVGTVGITFNNFSVRNIPEFDKWRPLPVGDGQKLSLRVQANGRQFQNYSATFSEPWLGGKKPNNFSINLNRSVQRNYGTGLGGGYGGGYGRRGYGGGFGGGGYGGFGGGFGIQQGDSLRGSLEMTGVTVSLGRRVQWPDDYFTVSNSVSYMLYDLFNYGNSLGFSTGQSNSITLENTISRNSIDNPMFPRRGSEISLKASFTPPYSAFNDVNYDAMENSEKYEYVEYHKWMFDAKYYTRVIGDLVFATKAHFGFIGSYTEDVDTGPFERFYLGGDGMTGSNFLLGSEIVSLRGYENRSIVPVSEETGFRGGTAYNKFSMELRYPLSLKQSATIYGLTFLEAGNNVSNMTEFNPFENFRSAGVGARIFMPAFGLIGVDWGYGFDPAPGQTEPSGGQFHFTIGQQIR